MIELRLDSEGVVRSLDQLTKAAANLAPAMAAIAGIMHDAVEENFAQEGRPKWLGLKPPVSTLRQGGKILQASGRLASSIIPQSDAMSASVGTNVKYAAIHQLGGKTRPHKIVARNKKALAFGGVMCRSVNHPGSNIPARPFLLLTPGDEEKIVRKVSDYLRNAIG